MLVNEDEYINELAAHLIQPANEKVDKESDKISGMGFSFR